MGSSFTTDGFPSDEISQWESDFEQRYKSRFELSVSVNHLAHQMVFSLGVSSDDLKDLVLSSLLVRQISTFQGFVLLARKGLIFQPEILEDVPA